MAARILPSRAKGLLALAALLAGASAFAQSAAISSTPATLDQGNLRGATVSVTLTGATYASGAASSHFTLTTAVPGLTIYSIGFNTGRTVASLRLHYDGSDFDAAGTIAVTVAPAGTSHNAALTTSTQAVTPARWVNVSKKSIALTEGGATATYTVALESPPTGNVTVTITSDNTAVAVNTGIGFVYTATLTFTTTNWNTAQTVNVLPFADNADAVDELALVTNVATGGGYAASTAASRTVRVTVDDDEQTGTDYDTDDDGLIEISGHAQLNAVRWDLDGNGSSANSGYATAFPSAATGMGCPDGGDSNQTPDSCLGYELTANIDLDTDGDGTADSGDAYWNSGNGWDPIGAATKTTTTGFTATLRGNGYTISNLYMGGTTPSYGSGLFAALDTGARIESLGLLDVDMTAIRDWGGAVVGVAEQSTFVGVFAYGRVRTASASNQAYGGLAGNCWTCRFVASYADVDAHGDGATGLANVVANQRGTVEASYAAGALTAPAGTNRGGLLLRDGANALTTVVDSYWDRQATGVTTSTGSPNADGLTTAALQAPTAATGIYAQWDDYDLDGDGRVDADDDAWNFGQANQYPVLKWAGHTSAAQFQAQLSGQTDTAPTYGSVTVSDQTYDVGERIRPLQIPAPTAGNGTYDYTVTGLPTGLVFDEDGSGNCMAARTVCGTPSVPGSSAVTVTVQDADTNMASSDQASLTFTIMVGSRAVVVAPNRLSLTEGGSGTYTAVLSFPPSSTVTVALSSDNPAVSLDASSLMFTTLNWATAQTVTATSAGDADSVDELATISNAASGGGYVGVSASVQAMVRDDEAKTGTDYDADNDGLIEVDSLAKLNALRWDLDGDGTASSGNETSYANAFGSPAAGMGCPDGADADQLPDACAGYELTADLDFDTDGDGDVDADDAFASWTPIAGYAALLDGKGHAIANLTVNATSSHSGLFSTTAAGSTIRALGLVDARVSSSSPYVGALAGTISGRVEAVYATGSVSGQTTVGGLVGQAASTAAIVASYSTVAVQCTSSAAGAGAAGLISYSDGPITASYSTGAVTGACPIKGGLVSSGGGTVTASYWDTGISGIVDDADSAMPEGLSTSAMYAPTAYATTTSLVYADWNDQDVDDDGIVDADPWDFGTDLQHPVLKWGGLDPADQRTDYDFDNDGLIEITTLAQLNAVRWDLDGDGAPSSGSEESYIGAFFNAVRNPSGEGFCPPNANDADDNDCLGYELANDLDFDTDGDGATHTNGTGDAGDAWNAGGSGWDPIGDIETPDEQTHFRARFDGNGYVIDNLYVNRGRNYSGLFAAFSDAAVVTSLGLPNARVQNGDGTVGLLAGLNRGHIAAAWVSGFVSASTNVGGLVGVQASSSTIVASYSTAAVTCFRATGGAAGGLAAYNNASSTIEASYSTGTVTGTCSLKSGLARNLGTVEASYWDVNLSDITTAADNSNSSPAEGKTSSEMRTPTAYGADSDTSAIYSSWDDRDVDGDGTTGEDADGDPWDFGLANAHPILKYRGLSQAPQLSAQPDSAPSFGAGSVTNKSYQNGLAIQSFQIPAATGGNGVVVYAESGLPAGLSLGLPSCADARTVCGTPTMDTAAVTVTITVSDADSNMDATDEDTLTFTVAVVTPSAAISAPAALAEATLNTATVTVALTNAAFETSAATGHFTLNTNPTLSGLFVSALGTITAGDTSATLTLGWSGDFNTVRTLSVTVADAAHTLAGSLTTGTINIVPTPSVTVSRSSLSLTEGGSSGTYTVVLDAQPTANATVTVTSADTGAVAVDTSTASGLQDTLTFTVNNWNTAQTVTAAPVDDDDAVDESVTISHAVSGYGAVTTATSVSVTVNDDETAGFVFDADPGTATVDEPGPVALQEDPMHADNTNTYTVRLLAQPTGAVTVTVTSADTAAVTVDTSTAPGAQSTLSFTTSNWDTAQTVTLAAVQDDDPINETVAIGHSGANGGYTGESASLTATVADDDTRGLTLAATTLMAGIAEGASATYTVVLDTLPTGPVTVAVSSSDSAVTVDTDATAGGNQNTLLFNAMNWSTPQTVTVRSAEDDDGESEMVTLVHNPNGADYGGVANADVSFTVTDNDTRGMSLFDSAGAAMSGTYLVYEDSTRHYTLKLDTEPVNGNVTVAVATSSTATATVNPSSLTFTQANWAVPQAITITGVADADTTDDNVSITHVPSGADYGSVTLVTLAARIQDSDVAGLTVVPGSLSMAEGATATYTVRLNVAPTAAVTVTVTGATAKLTVDTDTETTGDQTTLSFSTTNWDTAQPVTVTGVADDDGEDEVVPLNHTVTGTGNYASLSILRRPGISVRVRDDERAGVALTPPSLAIDEGDMASYDVVLSAPPASGNATVTVAATGSAGLTVDTSTLTFTTTTWDTAQTVTVTAAADHARLEDAAGTLTHTVSGYGTVDAGPDLPVRVANTTMDYDPDADGLISVASLAQLNAMRWDLDGDGTASSGDETDYAAAFPNPRGASVCPTATSGVACIGFELLNDLDFDTDGDGATHRNGDGDSDDDYDNGGDGWEPIGAGTTLFTARFDGNGRLVRNLFVNRSSSPGGGLFGAAGPPAGFYAVGLPNARVLGARGVGALIGRSSGVRIVAAWSTGSVSGSFNVGGLAGETADSVAIVASYSTAAVECTSTASNSGGGGLAGGQGSVRIATVETSWAAGAVTGACPNKNGLVGGGTTATASYWDARASGIADDADTDSPEGLSTSALQSPTGYTDIYANWNIDLDGDYAADDPWDFGSPRQYPSLKWRGFDTAQQFAVAEVPDEPEEASRVPTDVRTETRAQGLLVTWRAAAGATAYRVQWRLAGQAWSSERQAETTETNYELAGLPSGVYEVRVLAVFDGEVGEPSEPVRGESDTPNRPPQALGIADVDLDVGETAEVDLDAAFSDPDGDVLRYSVSVDGDAAQAWASGGTLRLRGMRPGEATGTITARDPEGLSASTTFRVAVGAVLSLRGSMAAPEGGDAALTAELSRALRTDVTVSWRLAPDGDPSTADANEADFAAWAGTTTIAAGQTTARIVVSVLDDDDIEPAREHFAVELQEPEDDNVGLSARAWRALAMVQEGVCDRTPEVRAELSRGWRACRWPAPADLARLMRLEMRAAGAGSLHSDDLLGLSGLRELDLGGNALRELPAGLLSHTPRLRSLRLDGNRLGSLPAGLFEGVSGLRELRLAGNPGAPFALAPELRRTDAEPWAAGPATVDAHLPPGAPIALRQALTITGGEASAEELAFAAGAVSSGAVRVSGDGPVRVLLAAPTIPETRCGDVPCFDGLAAESAALALFAQPPRVSAEVPTADVLGSGDARIDLSAHFAASGDAGGLTYTATVDDAQLVSVSVAGSILTVAANDDFEEGTAVVTVVATDEAGQTATLRFQVEVSPRSPGRWRGWRSTIAPPTTPP